MFKGLLAPQLEKVIIANLGSAFPAVCPSNYSNGLHMFKGLLAPQLGKVIIAKGFTTLSLLSPQRDKVTVREGFTKFRVFFHRTVTK